MIRAVYQRVFKFLLYLLPVAGLGFATFFVLQTHSSTAEAQATAPPTSKPAGMGIAASGIVEAASQNIPIGAPVPGVVIEVIPFSRTRTPVKAGELLFKLDARQLKAELETKQKGLESAEAQLKKLRTLEPMEIEPYKLLVDQSEAALKELQFIHNANEK